MYRKDNVELDVANLFAAFLRARGFKINAIRPGDPNQNEPDAILDTPDGPLGVEVSSGFYDERDALDVWSIRRGHPERVERMMRPGESIRDVLARVPVMKDPDADLVASLQRAANKHVERGPYLSDTYLVLDGRHAAITTVDDGPRVAAGLVVPSASSFIAIYVLLAGRSHSDGPNFVAIESRP